MNKNDLRVIKTHNALKNALIGLLNEGRKFYDLSIKEICDRAVINRRTFYLHYNNIEDILLEIQIDIAKSLYEKTKDFKFIDNPQPFVSYFIDFAESSLAYSTIITTPLYEAQRNEGAARILVSLGNDTNLSEKTLFYRKTVLMSYHNVLITIYREWVKNKRMIPKEELINSISLLLQAGIIGMKENGYIPN